MIHKWMMMVLVLAVITGCMATDRDPVAPSSTAEAAAPPAETAQPAEAAQQDQAAQAEEEAQDAEADTVVLTVGQTEITQAELDERMQNIPAAQRARSRAQLVRQLVTRAMYREFVRAKNLTVDDEEYEQTLARQRERFEAAMAREREAFEGYVETLRPSMALNAYVETVVSDEQVDKLMADHPEFFDGTKVTVSHILIKCNTWDSTADQTAARDKLQGIVDRINNRELTFAEAARQFSECPSSDKGGDLGQIEFGGPMDPYFTIQAFSTDEGRMSEIFRTTHGWHVVLVTDVQRGDGTPKPWASRGGSEIQPESLAQRALRAMFENEIHMAAMDLIPIENDLPPLPEPPAPPAPAAATDDQTADE